MKYIKNVILILLVLFISQPIFADYDDIIVIGGDNNYPPYEYVDENGDYRGFNVDIMRALALETGINIRFSPMDWNQAQIALDEGQIDAIQGMSYNESRAKKYAFSDEYVKNSLIYFVKKEDPFIFETSDLEGKKVAIQKNDLAQEALSNVKNIEVITFPDLEESLDKLVKGQVDVVLGSKLVGSYIIRKKNYGEEIKKVGYEFNQTPYGIAFQKGDKKLRDKFNKGLENIKDDGIYQKIYEKWFGEEETGNLKTFKYAIYILSGILIGVSAIFLFIYRINSRLKKEVKKRTQELHLRNKELKEKQKIIEGNYRFKKQIVDNLGVGLITFDKEGFITTINKACEELINKGEELIGQDYLTANLDEFFDIDKIKSAIKDEEKSRYSEKEFIKDNREITFSYTIWPLYGDKNTHIGGVLTFSDITDVIMYEKKLNQKDKMESLGRLVSGIAHEIRNPLTAIKTYIDLLPIKYDNEKFRDKITNQVPKEIERLNNLLTELLDYSKPKKLKKENVKVRDLIDGVLEFFLAEL